MLLEQNAPQVLMGFSVSLTWADVQCCHAVFSNVYGGGKITDQISCCHCSYVQGHYWLNSKPWSWILSLITNTHSSQGFWRYILLLLLGKEKAAGTTFYILYTRESLQFQIFNEYSRFDNKKNHKTILNLIDLHSQVLLFKLVSFLIFWFYFNICLVLSWYHPGVRPSYALAFLFHVLPSCWGLEGNLGATETKRHFGFLLLKSV